MSDAIWNIVLNKNYCKWIQQYFQFKETVILFYTVIKKIIYCIEKCAHVSFFILFRAMPSI